jgi:hypothetical protein
MRERLPAVGDELIDGYLARRFVDSDVEIAFVSTWERLPQSFSLEEPLFPDLAKRQEGFSIRTFYSGPRKTRPTRAG